MSPRLRDYRPRDLTRAFERKLGIQFREGKHRTGWYRLPGTDTGLFPVTLPKAHRRWSPSVRHSLFKATRLSPEEYDDLVRCPMTGPQFEARARELFGPE